MFPRIQRVNVLSYTCRFTPDTLIELTKSKNIDLGLVIDLTFTDRYYNRKNFTDQGVAYEKIFVPGHVIPDDEIVNR